MKVLIIIPAFNEENSILQVAQSVQQTGYNYIIINDASVDNTAEICQQNHLNATHLAGNLGIGGAMQTGFKYALNHDYDYAVQLDGDGQHLASEIPKLIETIQKENADLVIGSRYIDDIGYKSSAARRLGIRFFSILIKLLTGQKIADPTSGFRIINRKVIEIFAEHYPTDYPEPESLVSLAKSGYRITETATTMRERKNSKSSITAIKSIYYMIKVTIGCIIATGDKL